MWRPSPPGRRRPLSPARRLPGRTSWRRQLQRNRPPSAQAVSVLRALAADPARWRYGYDLAAEVHLKSGSLYPILVRLADRGLLETSWEAGRGSRPPRHLYRLTPAGREYVAALPADLPHDRRRAMARA